MAQRVWKVGLGLVALVALAASYWGCSGSGGGNNCGDVENPCTENTATRCNGANTGIQTCAANADGCLAWTDSTSCVDGEVCDDSGTNPECVGGCTDECPVDGETGCVETVIYSCVAQDDGCTDWIAGTDCAASGDSCDDSAEPAVCVDPCGDGTCDEAGGETIENCPEDCDRSCEARVDCLRLEWNAGCDGRWDCVEDACVEVCDYVSCGDALCNAAEGENAQTCPRDCLEGCTLPTDCYLEQWGQICQGRWNCFGGECQEVCDSSNCGNGVCWGLNGENEDSCFVDCLGGPCEALIDCFAHRWYEDFGGHWQCNPPVPPGQLATGACEAVRDDTGCGDGTCDVLGGETPVACVADCSDYSCTRSEDCNTLTLPNGCTSWICSSLVCVPQQCD